ncbi:hypothetical protein MTO96_014335 [Rhipicephalus appendiculatus]
MVKLGKRDLPVSVYVAPLGNTVQGVVYNAYDECPVELRVGFLKKNEGMEILDLRHVGKSKAIQIVFGGETCTPAGCLVELSVPATTAGELDIKRTFAIVRRLIYVIAEGRTILPSQKSC